MNFKDMDKNSPINWVTKKNCCHAELVLASNLMYSKFKDDYHPLLTSPIKGEEINIKSSHYGRGSN